MRMLWPGWNVHSLSVASELEVISISSAGQAMNIDTNTEQSTQSQIENEEHSFITKQWGNMVTKFNNRLVYPIILYIIIES